MPVPVWATIMGTQGMATAAAPALGSVIGQAFLKAGAESLASRMFGGSRGSEPQGITMQGRQGPGRELTPEMIARFRNAYPIPGGGMTLYNDPIVQAFLTNYNRQRYGTA